MIDSRLLLTRGTDSSREESLGAMSKAGGVKGAAKGKKAGGGGGKKVEDEREETLQAVVCLPAEELEEGRRRIV